MIVGLNTLSIKILILLFLVSACGIRTQTERQEFIIEGSITHASGYSLSLEELTPSELIPLDSIHLGPNGQFHYRHPLDEPTFFELRLSPEEAVTLLISPGERIRLQADASDLALTYQVQGSEGSALMATLVRQGRKNRLLVDSLASYLRGERTSPDFLEKRYQVKEIFNGVYLEQQALLKDFVLENPRSLVSIIALYQFFGGRLLMNIHEHFEYYESLSKSLSAEYPLNVHVMDLNRRVSEYRRRELQREMAERSLMPGNPAPEIILPDTAGNPLSLSSFRGHIVLIDFWASWCPPCRQSNAELRPLYERFHPKGFEIFAVSLDRSRDKWLAGMNEDMITWPQVSDLRSWNSPVTTLYNLSEIPHAMLIDRDGTILRRFIKPAELEAVLTEMLGE